MLPENFTIEESGTDFRLVIEPEDQNRWDFTKEYSVAISLQDYDPYYKEWNRSADGYAIMRLSDVRDLRDALDAILEEAHIA